jgi:hypothetical protein
MNDYRVMLELGVRSLEGALYLSDAKMLRRLSEAPIFGDAEVAVEIIAGYPAVLEGRWETSKVWSTRTRSVEMRSQS